MKVGDYVRTKNKAPFEPSQIAKITDMKKDVGYKNQYFITLDHNLPTTYNFHIYSEDVIKSSPNIIDLIEEGDIVNYGLLGGGMVIFKKDGEITTNTILFSTLKEKDIKKIITKEQIENMEYEVK